MLKFNNNQSSVSSISNGEDEFSIRCFKVADFPDVVHLYQHGLLGGHLDATDHAGDMADIEKAYFRRPQDHFWVAQAKGEVIGTIAISEDAQRIMHLRRLRVAPFWQLESRVAAELVRTAIIHARHYGCLKLVFHTSLDSETAVELLDGLGLQLSKIRIREGQHLIEFYQDLYAVQAGGGTDRTDVIPRD
jgi:N-acetylglutamate synthase-like GNAT family acetyltransferase